MRRAVAVTAAIVVGGVAGVVLTPQREPVPVVASDLPGLCMAAHAIEALSGGARPPDDCAGLTEDRPTAQPCELARTAMQHLLADHGELGERHAPSSAREDARDTMYRTMVALNYEYDRACTGAKPQWSTFAMPAPDRGIHLPPGVLDARAPVRVTPP